MPLSSRVRSFMRNLVSPVHADSELERELDVYVELLTDERMRAGDHRHDVRRRVLAEIGGKERVKERVRERRIGASGVAIGLVAAFGLARLIESLLYAVSPTGPATYAIVAALVLAVSLLACAVPAYRAAQIDPMKTLRLEQ